MPIKGLCESRNKVCRLIESLLVLAAGGNRDSYPLEEQSNSLKVGNRVKIQIKRAAPNRALSNVDSPPRASQSACLWDSAWELDGESITKWRKSGRVWFPLAYLPLVLIAGSHLWYGTLWELARTAASSDLLRRSYGVAD